MYVNYLDYRENPVIKLAGNALQQHYKLKPQVHYSDLLMTAIECFIFDYQIASTNVSPFPVDVIKGQFIKTCN